MPIYTCDKCQKIFKTKYNYERHMRTHDKSINPNILTDNICVYCNNTFVKKHQLQKHIYTTCKKNPNYQIDIKNQRDQMLMKHQMSKMMTKINNLEKQVVNNGITVSNNIYINNVNIIKQNIFINNFKEEQPIQQQLPIEELQKIVEAGCMAISKLISCKHYNKDIPENHNIYMDKKKSDVVMIFNGIEFIKAPIDDIINFLISNSHDEIKKLLIMPDIKIDSNQRKYIYKLINKIHENNPETKEKLVDDLREVMYNNKDLVLETYKKLVDSLKENKKITILTNNNELDDELDNYIEQDIEQNININTDTNINNSFVDKKISYDHICIESGDVINIKLMQSIINELSKSSNY